METIFDKYKKELDPAVIESDIRRIQDNIKELLTVDYLKRLFGFVDLTSLNTEDDHKRILSICDRVNRFGKEFPDTGQVAAVCVYPSMVPLLKRNLEVRGVKIASVAGGFPSSQTFLEVKQLEAEMAVEAGANEIDMVMSVGSFLAGDYIGVAGEIAAVKKTIGDAHLKVILETGLLKTNENIRNASILAMQAGADFIKTSTGKLTPAATYEAVWVMADAAGEFYRKTGRKTGIKPAGGIADPDAAAVYSAIVQKLLGDEWLIPGLFRIGASRLANNLLTSIRRLEENSDREVNYF